MKGVIYVATGENYLKEALRSISSLRKHMPDVNVCLFTDMRIGIKDVNQIIHVDRPHFNFLDKIAALIQSPYDYSLYLDADTYICDSVEDIFSLLDKFEFAAAHAAIRYSRTGEAVVKSFVEKIPACFPELNGGVVAFRKNSRVEAMLRDWYDLYENILQEVSSRSLKLKRIMNDQQALRYVLYNSDVRFTVLPPEYNCRFNKPGYLEQKVKILHGRTRNYMEIERKINEIIKPRVHVYSNGRIRLFYKKKKSKFALKNMFSKWF